MKQSKMKAMLAGELATLLAAHYHDIGYKKRPRTLRRRSKMRCKRQLSALVSDTHFGLAVDPLEVPGGRYDWNIATRRLETYAAQVIDYKTQYRDQTSLNILLGGDIMHGVIHLSDSGIDFLSRQIVGSIQLLSQFVEACADYFPKVRVICTSGNHDRCVHQSNERALSQKWDSYATIVYRCVQMNTANLGNVSWDIPDTPYTLYKVFTHDCVLMHGDTNGKVPHPSKSINAAKVIKELYQLNTAHQIQLKSMALGHHHQYWSLQEGDCRILGNGSLIGMDTYSQSLGNHTCHPHQIMWESTPEFAVGDTRIIALS